MDDTQRILLALLAVFVAALVLGTRRAARGMAPAVRPIPAFGLLLDALRHATEAGRAVHVALGSGSVWGSSTADSLAGLQVLESVAAHAAPLGPRSRPIVTVGDATLLPLAQLALRRPYRDAPTGQPRSRPAPDVRWLSSTPAAYAAGVMGTLGSDAKRVEASVMVGAFGDEYLLMGEAGVRHHVCQVGGASQPAVLPFVHVTADESLLGEEMYAAGAYLAGKPWHIGSLWAQDVLRWVIVLAIIGGAVVNTVM